MFDFQCFILPLTMIGGSLEDWLKTITVHDILSDRRRWAALKSMEGKGIISLIGWGAAVCRRWKIGDPEIFASSLCFTSRKPVFPFFFRGSSVLVQQYPSFRSSNSFVLMDKRYKSPGEEYWCGFASSGWMYSHDCPGTFIVRVDVFRLAERPI